MTIILRYFAESGSFCAHYVKVVEDTMTHSWRVKCNPKNLVFSGILLITIFTGNYPKRGL